MNISKYKITTDDLDKIVNYLIEQLPFDYENHSRDMTVLAQEKFYFRNNSTQLNMIIAKRVDSSIHLDVIGSAGGTGLFNFNLWSEKGFLKRVKNILKDLDNVYGLEISEIH